MTINQNLKSKENSQDPAHIVFTEATESKGSESFIIPFVFASIIIGTAFALPETFVYGISLHWADLIAGGSAFLTFAGWRLVRRFRPNMEYHGLKLWIIAGLIANLAPQLGITLWAGKISVEYLVSSITGIIAYPFLMTIIGVLVASWINSRLLIRELAKDQAKLLAMQSSLDSEISQIKSQLSELVESRLATLLKDAPIWLSASNSESRNQVSSQIRTAIDSVIRPLSRQLAFDDTGDFKVPESFAGQEAISSVVTKSDRKEAMRKIALAEILSPSLILVPATIFILPALVYIDGILAAAQSALSLIVIGVILRRSRHRAARIQLAPVINVAVGTTYVGFIAFISSLVVWQFDFQSVGPAAITTSVTLCAFGALAFLQISERRHRNILDRKVTNDAIELLVSQLRQEVWVRRRQLARIVHGKIQSKLLAASMRLSAIQNPTAQDLELVQADIVTALNGLLLEIDEDVEDFATQFSHIEDAWDGVCELSLRVSDNLLKEIDSSPNARTCVSEVIGEAVANAAKHSTASKVEIDLELTGDGYVSIEIATAGEFDATEGKNPGYGSQLLDEITTKWERVEENGVIRLRALVALDAR